MTEKKRPTEFEERRARMNDPWSGSWEPGQDLSDEEWAERYPTTLRKSLRKAPTGKTWERILDECSRGRYGLPVKKLAAMNSVEILRDPKHKHHYHVLREFLDRTQGPVTKELALRVDDIPRTIIKGQREVEAPALPDVLELDE